MNTTTKARSVIAAITLIGSLVTGAKAALLLSFDQVGNDIVMTTTGSVNVANATQNANENGFASSGGVYNLGAAVYTGSSQTVHVYTGISNDSTWGMVTPGFVAASQVSGDTLWVTGTTTDFVWFDENSLDFGSSYSPNSSMTFQNMTIQDVGLAAFTSGVTYDTWQARSGAGNSEKIQIRVTYTSVPEPSSALLLGFGCLSLAFRRSRHY